MIPAGGPVYLVTCEHGGHDVPPGLRALFAGADSLLASHRGWDAGALHLARRLAEALEAPLRFSTTTRLVVDPNRAAHNPAVFSEWTRMLPLPERAALLAAHHAPYRTAVDADVRAAAERGVVVHLAIHSFTPVLDGVVRTAELALLYDPRRERERALGAAWAAGLGRALPELRVRRNYPYRGRSDGLTTWLRGRHAPERYLGLEVEVSQALLDVRGHVPERVAAALVATLCRAVGSGAAVSA